MLSMAPRTFLYSVLLKPICSVLRLMVARIAMTWLSTISTSFVSVLPLRLATSVLRFLLAYILVMRLLLLPRLSILMRLLATHMTRLRLTLLTGMALLLSLLSKTILLQLTPISSASASLFVSLARKKCTTRFSTTQVFRQSEFSGIIRWVLMQTIPHTNQVSGIHPTTPLQHLVRMVSLREHSRTI